MSEEKQILHSRNRHRSRYNFEELIKSTPELKVFIARNHYGDQSIDFANPHAVKALNKALLKYFYDIQYWDIPENYLCPPIPGRVDYIHYLADLLHASNGAAFPKKVKALDIGMGANCVYPILGHQEYGWSFVGSDIDLGAVKSARNIVAANPPLKNAIICRLQNNPLNIFKGVVKPGELFDVSICNPPFHASAEEARTGTQRKLQNLSKQKSKTTILNFGGQNGELWYNGGEIAFIRKMIEESAAIPKQCFWFSTLISKSANLPFVYKALEKAKATEIKTIDMAQGQKISRFVAWTFLTQTEQRDWASKRWG